MIQGSKDIDICNSDIFGVIKFLSVPSVSFQACEKNTKGDMDGEPCLKKNHF